MPKSERAVSPVVAVALLIGITALLATTVALAMFGTDLGGAEQPEVTLSFEVDGDDNVVVVHEGGDPLDPETVVVRADDGSEYVLLDDTENVLEDDLAAGGDALVGEEDDPITTDDDVEEVTVVWQNPRPGNNAETILGTFRV